MTRTITGLALLGILSALCIHAALAQDAGTPQPAPPLAQSRPIPLVYWIAECSGARPDAPTYTGPGDLFGVVRSWVQGKEVSLLLQTPTGRVMVEAYRLGTREAGWRTWSIRGPRRLYRWQLARPERCRTVQTYRDAHASPDVLWRDWIAARVDSNQAGTRFLPPVLAGGDDDNDPRPYLAAGED